MLNDYGKSVFKPLCSVQNVALLLTVLFVFGLAIKTYALSSSEIASWVQAVGSVMAIWGAFRVGSLAHEREVKKARTEASSQRRQTVEILRLLAESVWSHTTHLRAVLHMKISGEGDQALMTYHVCGVGISWSHLLESLRAVDINDLNAVQHFMLIDIKNACRFSERVCEDMEGLLCGSRQISVIVGQLDYHIQRSSTAAKHLASCD